MKILVPSPVSIHADSQYSETNSVVSVCIAANCVLQKKKTTRCTSRSAALTAMNCLPTKITRGLTMEQEARGLVFRSNGRIAQDVKARKHKLHLGTQRLSYNLEFH